MDRRIFLLQVTRLGLLATPVTLGGCGALLHSERVGQPHSRDLDWKVVALDGLGLLLFFVPGVVAFAVDFATGAIYLPYESASPTYTRTQKPSDANKDTPIARTWQDLKRRVVPPEELSVDRIETEVSQHLGKPVSLKSDQTRVSALADLEQFSSTERRHRADPEFGMPIRRLIQG